MWFSYNARDKYLRAQTTLRRTDAELRKLPRQPFYSDDTTNFQGSHGHYSDNYQGEGGVSSRESTAKLATAVVVGAKLASRALQINSAHNCEHLGHYA